MPADSTATIDRGAARVGLMLDSTAAVAEERQGKNARQLLEAVALIPGLTVIQI